MKKFIVELRCLLEKQQIYEFITYLQEITDNRWNQSLGSCGASKIHTYTIFLYIQRELYIYSFC